MIIRARARDYLCLRHQQWLRGIHRPSLAALPELTDSQRRHDRRTGNIPDKDIARAHRQAQDITGQWLATGWHPALTERWQGRHRRLTAARRGPGAVLADVITHPEMLAVARLLIASQPAPGIQPREIAACLGFPYPSRPTRSTLSRTTCPSSRGPTQGDSFGSSGERLGFASQARVPGFAAAQGDRGGRRHRRGPRGVPEVGVMAVTFINLGAARPGRSCRARDGRCSCGWAAANPATAYAEETEHLYGDLTGRARAFAERPPASEGRT